MIPIKGKLSIWLGALWMLWAIPAQGSTIAVPQGGDLKAAIDASRPGDVITLEPGIRVYQGEFFFPERAEPGVTLRTSATLPEGRIDPELSGALLPVIGSGVGSAPIVGVGATNWRFEGFKILPNPGGYGELIQLQDAKNIYMKQLVIKVPGEQQQKRGILGNGQNITLVDSSIQGIWRDGQDSQAFCAWDGAGPYRLANNDLQAASENVMFGGSDSLSADRVPNNIVVEDNLIWKPLEWKGTPRVLKNLIEFKSVRNAVARRNTFRNNWEGGQAGFAVQITPRNQEGRAPWSTVEDVLLDGNIFQGVDRFANVLGIDNEQPSLQATRIKIVNNTVACNLLSDTVNQEHLGPQRIRPLRMVRRGSYFSWALQVGGEVGGLEFSSNKLEGCTGIGLYSGQVWAAGESAPRNAKYAADRFAVYDNGPVWFHSSEASGEAALKMYTNAYSLTGPLDPPSPPVDLCPPDQKVIYDRIRARLKLTLTWPMTKKVKTNIAATQTDINALAALNKCPVQ